MLNYIINFINLRSISKRGRAIALSAVGGIFLLLILLALWQRYFADNLIKYVPSDAVVYVHLSQPKINNSAKIDETIAKILNDFKLTDIESLNINREMAIVGQPQNNQVKYSLILATDRPSKAVEALKANGVTYKFLTSNKIAIGESDLLSSFVKNNHNKIAVAVKRKFMPFSTVKVFASADFLKIYNNDPMLTLAWQFLQDQNGDLLFDLKAQKNGLRVDAQKSFQAVGYFGALKADKSLNLDGDLVLSITDSAYAINSWQKFFSDQTLKDIVNYNFGFLGDDAKNIFLFVKNNPTAPTDWFFSDYDFYASFDNIDESKVVGALQEIMAKQFPVSKKVSLSDGTVIKELVPDPASFTVQTKGDVKIVYSPDEKIKLMLRNNNGIIAISNSEELLNQSWPALGSNYLKFNSQLLPDFGVWRYLRGFGYLEVSNNGLIIKN